MKQWPLSVIFAGILAVSGGVFGYFYFFNQFWTHVRVDRFEALAEYRGPCVRAHRGRQVLVHRDFLPVMARLETYAAARGLALLVTSSYRPPDRQVTDAIVAPAVRSNHLAGHALDFNVIYGGRTYESEALGRGVLPALPEPVRRFIGDVRVDAVMRWGGDFETEDPVHVDDGLNSRYPEAWDDHYHAALADYVRAERKWKGWIRKLFS